MTVALPVGLQIAKVAMTLGAAPTTLQAMALDVVAPAPALMNWQDSTIEVAFVRPFAAQESRNERLLALLQHLLEQPGSPQQNETVYLLLPEYAGTDNNELNTLLQMIMRRFPQLLQSADCRVFPYGSAGALMALAAAASQLQQGTQTAVWLLAVDSLASAAILSHYAASDSCNGVPSEGAMALCLTAGADGSRLVFSASDASPAATMADDPAMAALFMQVTTKVAQPLQQLYLPDSGDDDASARWLGQYHHLHGAVTEATGFVFPSYSSGELGTCGGLYRLWHLMQAQQKGRLGGLTLQCELSTRLYRAVAVLSPATALSDNKEV
ncbi:hypothetical protein [Rheinheimera sp.]|uniref:hypothetical protein n=1 Tax=Rheinheimera sp. TaxID=1869214 RepID=UPI002732CE22|nr:hypothetical protein [Rheinheimera sp.]MDP2713464.1 hypothetical protein [Rheinheimera sp.]